MYNKQSFEVESPILSNIKTNGMLEKIFGKGVIISIIETFLKNKNKEKWLNVREVARQSKIAAGTVSRRISELVELNILIEQNPSQYTRIFKLNFDNPYISPLLSFFKEIKEIG